ncbi:MAG: hypothetical protein MUP14_08880 [Dehalococcoidia bacterium]|nr:hypothetical protein [Dehalococcoidia bacterium]
MDTDGIANELDTFASWARSFTLQELLDFADSEIDREVLQRTLLSDRRFIPLGQEESNGDLFLPESALFRWFIHLSFRLAQAGQARLDQGQLAVAMSSLRHPGRWDVPPPEIVEFGERFGFCGYAHTSGQYVFPIAHLLSSMLPFYSKLAANLLQTSVELREPRAPSEARLRGLVQQSLSVFGDRTAYVVQAREGLLTGERETLEQIGSRLGVTRERVRQLEMKPPKAHWRRRRAFMRPLLVALLSDVMCRHGSLIFRTDSPGTSLKRFIAKHAGIPQWEVPGTDRVVLGASPDEAAVLDLSGWPPDLIATDTIADHLDSEGQFCLVDADLRVIAETIAEFRQGRAARAQRATKGQRVYLALREIGKPAHYTAVTEVYNRLFPDDLSSEHTVHAALSYQKHGVVWIGVKGTYALEEWGYERPSKTLFDAVADIVESHYEATGTPVPLTVIVAEMGKLRRVVKLASLVFATQCNRRLRRVSSDSFVPRTPDEQAEEEIAEDELDRILQEFEENVVGDSAGASATSAELVADPRTVPKEAGRLARLGSMFKSAFFSKKELDGEEEQVEGLAALLRSRGLEVIDDRPRGGCLWVVGGKELYSLLSPRGFIWGPRGAPATENRAGWYVQ